MDKAMMPADFVGTIHWWSMYVYVSWGVVTCLSKKHRVFWGMTSPIVRSQWIETCQQNWVYRSYIFAQNPRCASHVVHKPYATHVFLLGIFHRCIWEALGIWVVFLVTNLMGCNGLGWSFVCKLLFVTTVNVAWNGVFMVFGYSWKHMVFSAV